MKQHSDLPSTLTLALYLITKTKILFQTIYFNTKVEWEANLDKHFSVSCNESLSNLGFKSVHGVN